MPKGGTEVRGKEGRTEGMRGRKGGWVKGRPYGCINERAERLAQRREGRAEGYRRKEGRKDVEGRKGGRMDGRILKDGREEEGEERETRKQDDKTARR